MKKVLLLACIFLSFKGFSQTNFRFADSTAQWNVLYTSTGGTTAPGTKQTIVYTVQKDTVISGKSYQRIDDRFTRRDSTGVVYQISNLDTNEYVLYDFSKQGGDSIRNMGFLCCEILCVVDSVDSVFIGHNRKRMFV